MQPEEKEDGYTAAIRSRVSAWRNFADFWLLLQTISIDYAV
jgi:hypothetical protein